MSRGFSFWLVRILGWTSTACCLIVLAAFAVFVVNQTGAASRGQLQELGGSITAGTASAASNPSAKGGRAAGRAAAESPLHKWLDDSAETLRSPFSSLTSSHSEWYAEVLGTLLALLLYGVVLRFLARSVQVRAKPLG